MDLERVSFNASGELHLAPVFSPHEAQEAEEYILAALRILNPTAGFAKPDWLLNDWNANEWKTFGGTKTREVDGEWLGTHDINWEVMLPNGFLLTAPKYEQLLEFCRQVCASYRDGLNGGRAPALATWATFCLEVKRLCIWAVVHETKFRPEHYGFFLFDQTALQTLFNQLGSGGWTEAYLLGERILSTLYHKAFERECPPEYYEKLGMLPGDEREKICEWLRKNDGYSERPDSKGMVSREFLAELVACDVRSLTRMSIRLNAMIRQFEPDRIDDTGILRAKSRLKEHSSHRAIRVDEAISKPSSTGPVRMLSKVLYSLLLLKAKFPEMLPDPEEIDLKKLTSQGLKKSIHMKHVPFIPIPTGFTYLGEAIRWVDRYGDALVDFYLQVIRETSCDSYPYARQQASGCKRQARLIARIGIPAELTDFGPGMRRIYPDTSKKRDFEALRQRPTIHQALECWVGAVVVVIALLKPSRSSELANLSRDCLEGEGPYWLVTDLAKSGVKEYRTGTGPKPIPDIAARAIKQLQRFGSGLKEVYGESDSYATSRLFYLPMRVFGKAKVAHNAMLNSYLDRFCDFVGLPPDQAGRRWYVRVHEMRKWFLLLLVWSGRFNVFDAARFIAGHTNLTHLQAYIEREAPHQSLSEVECEYAADRLRKFEDGQTFEGEELGLNELYEMILARFQVASLEFVPARVWEDYLHELHESRAFAIELCTLKSPDGIETIEVAFRSQREILS